jgi:DNA repair protein RadC
MSREDQAYYNAAVNNADDAHCAALSVAKTYFDERDEEIFIGIPLNVRSIPLGFYLANSGGPDCVSVDPRQVFRTAIFVGASALIVAHNHPSGSPKPSPTDLELTRRLAVCGYLLGVPVLDHLILEPSGTYYPMADRHPELFDTPDHPALENQTKPPPLEIDPRQTEMFPL